MFEYLPKILSEFYLWGSLIIALLAPFIFFLYVVDFRGVVIWIFGLVLGLLWLYGLATFFSMAQDSSNFEKEVQGWATVGLIVLYLVVSAISAGVGGATKNGR